MACSRKDESERLGPWNEPARGRRCGSAAVRHSLIAKVLEPDQMQGSLLRRGGSSDVDKGDELRAAGGEWKEAMWA